MEKMGPIDSFWDQAGESAREFIHRHNIRDDDNSILNELHEVLFDLKIDAYKNMKQRASEVISEASNPSTEAGSSPVTPTINLCEADMQVYDYYLGLINTWKNETKYQSVTSYHLEQIKATGDYKIVERYNDPGPDKPDWTTKAHKVPNLIGQTLLKQNILTLR